MDRHEMKKQVQNYLTGMNGDSSISIDKDKHGAKIGIEGSDCSIIASFMLAIKVFAEKRCDKRNKTKSFENITTEFFYILSVIADFYEINHAEEKLIDVVKNHNFNRVEDLEVLLKVLQKVNNGEMNDLKEQMEKIKKERDND